ncbi:MAG: transcription termination/antitermination factor NusG [Bacteroidetes bacterium GWF2_42_66]|nr:MAG: transcription termination/antitermination factor NusG [Bacteroidetes bacterium GWA2_42_15]OFX99895.1 MAG: transcription termination/antitermination factor NusG [Bacteroidetes bacterium GWE2_42_39]OFY40080.1 MAG: transcription termination/antitermination factor NusG [Bacteroidetes bacterium GWF2_42_66]HBL73900.1 transcription termination/antitermination factor NusG [Prolixibacteraceae bacterium]HCR92010.1 transcription termination/antitermination factor NusG [Prolixibacteraceae bacterium
MSENVKRWYVLRTIGGKEKKVKEYIESEIANAGLQEYVSQVLIPTEKVFQIRNGKKISKERNFFPGYVLVEACLAGEIPHILKNITNVIGFLGDTKGGDPVPMRLSEVNRILGRVDEMAEKNEEMNIPYVVGETVKVIDGPFNGFNGIIEHINEEKKKLQVMVKIFGRKTPLELSYMQVEKE